MHVIKDWLLTSSEGAAPAPGGRRARMFAHRAGVGGAPPYAGCGRATLGGIPDEALAPPPARLLPDGPWSHEYLAELDHDLRRRLDGGEVRWPGPRRARGVGVGAVTAIHSVSERLFLGGPPHVEAPEALVRLYLEVPDRSGTRTAPYIPYLTARAIQENASGFLAASAYRLTSGLGRVGDGVETLALAEVDEAYFGLLGVRPVGGRFPGGGADDLATRPAVLSGALAVQRFGAPERALGRTVEMSGGVRHEIVGVAPQGFSGPHLERVDVWLPMDRSLAGNRNWWMLGRLAAPPDVDVLARLTAGSDAVLVSSAMASALWPGGEALDACQVSDPALGFLSLLEKAEREEEP